MKKSPSLMPLLLSLLYYMAPQVPTTVNLKIDEQLQLRLPSRQLLGQVFFKADGTSTSSSGDPNF